MLAHTSGRVDWRRMSAAGGVIACALAVAALAAAGLGIGAAASRGSPASPYDRPAPRMAPPTAHDRVLVVAPHPDDESVACGGLIAGAVAAGAAVHVVYITNGDAFRAAAQRLFSEERVPSRDYLRLAQMRQREALLALAKLGVNKGQAVFLGYPDRGIDQLWLRNWEISHPYTSHYTGVARSPYANSLRPNAPYAGRALLHDLEAAIREFGPTMVVAPHPRDAHGDHWASYCFTVAALYELKLLDSVKLWLYLVHSHDQWLSRSGNLMDPTAAPTVADDTHTKWRTLLLSANAALRKREAISEHATQLLVMGRRLTNFARRRELYGQVGVAPLGGLGAATAKPRTVIGSSRHAGRHLHTLSKQREQPASVTEVPRQEEDRGRRLTPDARIVAVQASITPTGLRVRLDLAGRPSPAVEYRVHWRLLCRGRVEPPEARAMRPTSQPHARSVETTLDLPDGVGALMLAADTRRDGKPLDRTSWALLKSQ